ncbi:acetate kinase [Litoribrevibacter euphylliae]|uniref:Acetate kinase n=1 Tax=Litoribrevibacter euphylliae TaxID=1834034 RepID=A0ABV7H9W9_9GAMM
MSSNILVINCGSSSLKFSVVDSASGQQPITGLAERLGDTGAVVSIKSSGNDKIIIDIPNGEHDKALSTILDHLQQQDLLETIQAVGHRVVHGGEQFTDSTVIDDQVLLAIEACNHLAPLHNPANLIGIRTCQKLLSNVPHVAVFDTAFHQTMPEQAYLYPIPYELYKEQGIRRYGFHGTSHRYVSMALADTLGKPLESLNLISAHLGNGCSAASIQGGKSIDTTMGLTPLEGLVMGTRSGDVDPSLHHFLCSQMKMSIDEVNTLLNKKSGLLGLSSLSNDMRTLEQASQDGNQQAELAIQVFCYRLAKHIAALAVPLGHIDGLIFTGGIGENSVAIRQRVLALLAVLGFKIDDEQNKSAGKSQHGLITQPESTPAYVVNTNEEWMIAKDTQAAIQ